MWCLQRSSLEPPDYALHEYPPLSCQQTVSSGGHPERMLVRACKLAGGLAVATLQPAPYPCALTRGAYHHKLKPSTSQESRAAGTRQAAAISDQTAGHSSTLIKWCWPSALMSGHHASQLDQCRLWLLSQHGFFCALITMASWFCLRHEALPLVLASKGTILQLSRTPDDAALAARPLATETTRLVQINHC